MKTRVARPTSASLVTISIEARALEEAKNANPRVRCDVQLGKQEHHVKFKPMIKQVSLVVTTPYSLPFVVCG